MVELRGDGNWAGTDEAPIVGSGKKRLACMRLGRTLARSTARLCSALGVLFCASVAQGGRPDEPATRSAGPDAAAQSRWAVQVSPYLWAAGLSGNVTPFQGAPTLSINKSFSDLMNDLKIGGFVNVWARYDRLVFSLDAMYVNLGEVRAIPAIPGVAPTPGLTARVDNRQIVATLQSGYRVLEMPDASLDALAGFRWWNLRTKASLQYDPYSFTTDAALSWVDPVIGLRGFYRLSDRFSTMVQADIGGFGAASKLTWQVLATVNYDVSDRVTASAGYKVLAVDYSSGGQVFDAVLSGPVLGLTWRF